MTAGATGTIVTNPLWVIKTRFMVRLALSAVLSRPQLTLLAAQTQERVLGEERYRHTLDAIVRIYKRRESRRFIAGCCRA